MALQEKIDKAKKEIIDSAKNSFYIVAYSGGKDSSVALDLLLNTLKENNLKNNVYILISRTHSEYPEFEKYLDKTLLDLRKYLKEQNLDNVQLIEVKTPEKRRFLLSLIGKGYPVPRNSVRWCTLHMKIDVMKKIEEELKKKHKELMPIKIIGARKEEGSRRKGNIGKYHATVTDGILTLMLIRDFSLEDIWLYIKNSSLFNKKEITNLYNNSESLDEKTGSVRQGCWFCPLIKSDKFLEKNYPSIEEYRIFLRNHMLSPGTRYEINRKFTNETAGPLKIHIREKFFKKLIEELSQVKNYQEFITEKEIINIQKEHIKEGWLTLNILKEYLKLYNNKDIASFVTSVDSINVLFPRFKAIKEHPLFQDIKVSDFCVGVAVRMLLKETILYGYKIKTINTPVEDLKVSNDLKIEYLNLLSKKKRTKNILRKDLLRLSLKIMHNYLYYLHKFYPVEDHNL